MREILFKAKRIDNGEWVEGYIVKYPCAVQIGNGSCWYIDVPPVDPDDNGGRYNVDPETVCQYTGLIDKNGAKIFEGDFVNVRTTAYMFRSCVVKWNESNAMWSVASGKARYRMSDSFKYEVIGNIHDKEE